MEKSAHVPEHAAIRAALCHARQAAGLSQRALAERLNVSPSWVAKVELGERRIDFVEVCWVFAACGLDVPAAAGALARDVVAATKSRSRAGGRGR